jgi:hypothetical protein
MLQVYHISHFQLQEFLNWELGDSNLEEFFSQIYWGNRFLITGTVRACCPFGGINDYTVSNQATLPILEQK